ncbi:MAG: hypothetical protein ACRD9R_10425, partial [Pyrinomonadaceae bacterium]
MNNPTDTPSEQNFERQFPPAAHHAAGQARDDAAATFAHEPGAEPANPDNPRWGIGAALLVWLSSVGLILFGSVLAVIGYAAYRAATGNPITAGSDPTKDPKLLLASVLTTVPAHLLTLVIAWWVATGGGRRSFKEALGLNWTGWPPALLSGGLAVLLYLTALPIASYFGGTETEIDRLIASSTAARIAVAFLAAFSAPIVEEVVYRG